MSVEQIVELAARMKEVRSDSAAVASSRKYDELKSSAIFQKKTEHSIADKLVAESIGSIMGVPVYPHPYLPPDSFFMFDTKERALRFLEALDRLQKAQKPWQLAIMEVSKVNDARS